jgi:hypothetical protein
VIITGVSLMVTLLTQMVSAFLGLRGTNLRWGIATLLKQLDPSLAEHAERISQAVLEHPLVSDSTVSRSSWWLFRRWRLASAVRKDEVLGVLHMLVQPGQGEASAANAVEWTKALTQALERLDQEPAENLVTAAPEIRKLFPDNPAKADQIVAQMMTSAETLTGGINKWFDSVMDRVSQRFAMHARIWTILFSVLIAFALHLDAPRLLTQLSSDSELRGRLVSSADALQKRADEILTTSGSASAAVYVDSMKQLIAAHASELKGIAVPAGFSDLAGGKQWLADQLKSLNISNPEQWQQEFEASVPQGALRSKADDLSSILKDKLRIQLVPDPYPRPFYNYWTPSWLHFWGVLASAALLSMGAPFWFNTLKTVGNLRPVLANKQKQESG